MSERYEGWDAHDLRDHLLQTERELAEAREWIEETGHRISCPWRHTKLTSTDLWPACDCGYIAILTTSDQPDAAMETPWQDIVRHATRYLWLRDNAKRTMLMRLPASYEPDAIDRTIDAAIAADKSDSAK